MSILVEIAERADVAVEGVVRVLTREPVSDAVKQRVLEVLDDLTPEQTRAVQRFALAALHDVLPRPGGEAGEEDDSVSPDQLELTLPVSTAAESELLPATGSEAALVQLSSVLGELAEAVRDLRRETDAERRERVDDLAVLIDLITTGWQGLDARLGRIERQVGRLESGHREPAPVPLPLPVAPAPVAPVPVAPAPVEAAAFEVAPFEPDVSQVPDVPPPAEPATRDRLPVFAALALGSAVIGTLAVLQLASGGPDLSGLVSGREPSSTTGPAATRPARPPATTTTATSTASSSTASSSTVSRPPATQPAGPATTSGVLGTTVGETRPRPPAVATASGTSSPAPATTTAPARTTAKPTNPARTTPPANPSSFRPTRSWAWAPVEGADYYDVVFTRAGASFYRASPAQARLTLPASLVFRAGSYRWVVRPGFGEPAVKNLGEPVVDSQFTVS